MRLGLWPLKPFPGVRTVQASALLAGPCGESTRQDPTGELHFSRKHGWVAQVGATRVSLHWGLLA